MAVPVSETPPGHAMSCTSLLDAGTAKDLSDELVRSILEESKVQACASPTFNDGTHSASPEPPMSNDNPLVAAPLYFEDDCMTLIRSDLSLSPTTSVIGEVPGHIKGTAEVPVDGCIERAAAAVAFAVGAHAGVATSIGRSSYQASVSMSLSASEVALSRTTPEPYRRSNLTEGSALDAAGVAGGLASSAFSPAATVGLIGTNRTPQDQDSGARWQEAISALDTTALAGLPVLSPHWHDYGRRMDQTSVQTDITSVQTDIFLAMESVAVQPDSSSEISPPTLASVPMETEEPACSALQTPLGHVHDATTVMSQDSFATPQREEEQTEVEPIAAQPLHACSDNSMVPIGLPMPEVSESTEVAASLSTMEGSSEAAANATPESRSLATWTDVAPTVSTTAGPTDRSSITAGTSDADHLGADQGHSVPPAVQQMQTYEPAVATIPGFTTQPIPEQQFQVASNPGEEMPLSRGSSRRLSRKASRDDGCDSDEDGAVSVASVGETPFFLETAASNVAAAMMSMGGGAGGTAPYMYRPSKARYPVDKTMRLGRIEEVLEGCGRNVQIAADGLLSGLTVAEQAAADLAVARFTRSRTPGDADQPLS